MEFSIELGEMEILVDDSSEDIRFRAGFRIVGPRQRLALLDVKPTTVAIS